MAIYYVSATTGHDSADGSAPIPDGAGAGPKATIGAAENLATSAGDIVYIAPGTYREQVLHGYSGTSGNRIYFIGDPDCDIFPNGEFSSPTYGVTPGVVRITRADSDEFCSDTSNDYCVKSNAKDYITWKNVHVDGVASGVNAYNDGNTGYGFYATGGAADNMETYNCMAQNLYYGFRQIARAVDCVSVFNVYCNFYLCGEVRNCVSIGSIFSTYWNDYIVNSIIHGNYYTSYYNDVVQNCMLFGSFYGIRGAESSVNQPRDILMDNINIGNYYGSYASSTAQSQNAIDSGSFYQGNYYISRYGFLHGLGQSNNYRHWAGSSTEPAVGKNGSTNMQGDGLIWPVKPQLLWSMEKMNLLKQALRPSLYSKGIQGCTSTYTEENDLGVLGGDNTYSGFSDDAPITRAGAATDILGNPRKMGSTRGMYMEGTGTHTTSSRDLGPWEFSNVETTGSFSSSAAGFKIEDEGLFRIPIAVSASVAITASIGVKHLSGVGTAIKPQFQLRYSESMPTASVDTPGSGMLTGSGLIIQSVTSTAADNVFETLTVSHSATENRELELICTNVQSGSDSISVFSDLEIK